MALSNFRRSVRTGYDQRTFPVKGGVTIHPGAIVCLEGGFAIPGKVDTGLICVGHADGEANNASGADGDITVLTSRDDVYYYDNSSDADEITLSDIGSDCFVVDDETVAKTDGGSARSVAGTVFFVDADGVGVRFK